MSGSKVKSTLYMLKAEHGDAFHLEVTDGEKTTNIIIDSGTQGSYLSAFKPLIDKIDKVDLCIITHFDEDHSKGLSSYLSEDIFHISKFEELWLNCPDLINISLAPEISAYSQCHDIGMYLTEYEKQNGIKVLCHDEIIAGHTYSDSNGLVKVTVLSPTIESKKDFVEKYKKIYPDEEISAKDKRQTLTRSLEDWSTINLPSKYHKKQIVNDCSIACLIETKDKSYLMLGDIREEIVLPWLVNYKEENGHNLKVDFLKVPHHGSMCNMSEKLLNLVDCNKYIISTNGRYSLPDRYTIAKILMSIPPSKREKITLYFNYDRKSMECNYRACFLKDEEALSGKYNFEIIIAGLCL